jgi:hypothetical protein
MLLHIKLQDITIMEGGGGIKIRKIIFYLAMLFLHRIISIRNCDCGARKIFHMEMWVLPLISGLTSNEQKELQSHVAFVCIEQSLFVCLFGFFFFFFLYADFCLEVETDAVFC